ncbi:MAG: universal stress protein [Deltaproteobacteria bacterium]|nr:universal stress protein [Deltaproteobacteria bacterium]
MFKTIYVPVDNSAHSGACIELAVALARRLGAALVGSHVYAATLHAARFRQMEPHLPAPFRDAQAVERQRSTHDGLLATGLRLISDAYLDAMERRCRQEGVAFERKIFDGQNYRRLVEDIRGSRYDLVVIGAQGMGAVKESQLGSVCERVVRRIRTDTLVVKETHAPGAWGQGPIVVGIDGSPQALAGLESALVLGKAFGRPVEAVAVYDPSLHFTIFSGLVEVLSEQGKKLFRLKDQERLHEQIIDAGLARIYRSHLEVAKTVAAEDGVQLKTTVLPGKPFQQLLKYVRQAEPWLLVVGRIGVHSPLDMDIGSTAENLLRLAPCNVLLSSRGAVPSVEVTSPGLGQATEEAS